MPIKDKEGIDMEDQYLGLKKSKMNATVPFKLAFNSLLNKKIIKKYDCAVCIDQSLCKSLSLSYFHKNNN